jgi:heat shock protein HslJ
MKTTLLKLTMIAVLGTGFLTSCSTIANPITNNQATNEGILGKWELDYIMTENGKSLADAYPMGVPTLNFMTNKTLSAYDGCNNLNGGVTVESNEITFGNLITTMKACQGVQDSNFTSKLDGKLKYSISDNTLTLIQGDIAIMRFKRPGTLAGTWELEEFIGKDKSAKTLEQRFPNQKPSLTFNNNMISGNDGCNNLSGGYLAIGNSLTMKNIATTRMACQGVDSNAFDERLNNVNKYEIENGKLVLYANDIKTMVFGKK